MFCHHCGLLGHDLNHYASYYAILKNGGEVRFQYGDWLRATGLRLWSPPKHDSSSWFSSSNTKGGTTANQEGRTRVHQQAVDTPFNAIPRSNVTYQNGNNGNKGVTPKLQEFKGVNAGNGNLATVMTKVNSKVTNSVEDNVEKYDLVTVIQELNLKTAASTEENESGRFTASSDGYNEPHSGPDKTKAEWTRAPRMDCGPSRVEEGEPRLILGKRDATQRDIEETNQGKEAQVLKRNQKNGDYSTVSTAGVSEHPCQSQWEY